MAKPVYEASLTYTIRISNKRSQNYETDIYYPILPQSNTKALPLVLFLQGALIDKSNYSNYATLVSRYGFVVIVPNCRRSIPEYKTEGLLVETGIINDVLEYLQKNEQFNLNSPISGILDTKKLFLLGHSWGGTVGLSAINNSYTPILYVDDFQRPDELKAAAFFGTSLPEINKNFQPTENFTPIKNDGIPIAILEASLDGVTSSQSERKTYESIRDSPKAFITVIGTNHYGITNKDNFDRRRNVPTLNQDVAVETIARWSALFLRATTLDDRDAKEYVFRTGEAQDENVIVNISC